MPVIVDTSKLSAAIKERLKYPGRTEAEVCNHAAYSVAHRAAMNMPFVTQEKIDTELGVATNLVLTKRGKFVRDKRKHTKTAGKMGDIVTDTTLAKLVVLARANLLHKGRQSNYNRLTNNRWKIDPAMLKGGASVIQSFISRMLKKRHSSTHFLQAGFFAIKKSLEPFIRKKILGPAIDGNPNLGTATPANEGQWSVEAVIENSTGLEGVNGPNYNQAMIKYGGPVLGEAVAYETDNLKQYMEEATRPLNDKFNAMCR